VKTREGTLAQNTPKPKKPYSAPRLVKYGDLRQLTRGSHGRRADNRVGTATRPCWIAEVLYGADDPRTHLLRIWLVDVYSKTASGSIVVAVYKRFGRKLSALVRRSSLLRGVLYPVFEAGLVRAQRHFISSTS
jgi:hypothetical protein